MNIRQNLVASNKYNIKCPYFMNPTRIIVHNTANDASAANEIAYMIRNDNEVSFHYAVDDKEVVQGVLENRNTWNAGDGENGKGNREGISIEICYSKSGGSLFDKAEENGAKFIAEILNRKGWGIDKVTKHQDYSGKYCPHRTLDRGWQRFLNMVKTELDKLEDNTIPPSENSTAFVKGDKVKITATGKAGADGSGDTAGGIGWVRQILAVHDGKAYPYQVGNSSGTTGFYKENSLQKVTTGDTATLVKGDKVKITATGKAGADGSGDTAGGIGWVRQILAIHDGKAYPYQVGNSSGTTGFYKENSLQKVTAGDTAYTVKK